MHVLALSPGGFGAAGLHTTARELQTCTFQGPGASNTTKIPRKDPQEREERKNIVAGDGKTARNFGPPTLRDLAFRGPTLQGAGSKGSPAPSPKWTDGWHPSGHHFSGPHLTGPQPSGPHYFQVWAPHLERPPPFAHSSGLYPPPTRWPKAALA